MSISPQDGAESQYWLEFWNNGTEKQTFQVLFTDKGFTDKGHPPFLQIRAFTNKGPTISTDKGFLQIRA